MEVLFAFSWRLEAAAVLGAAGVFLLAIGIRTFARSRGASRDPERALLVARGFRTGILGLCLCVFAAGFFWQISWLAALALIVVGEELLETSVMIAALEDGRRRARSQPPAA